MRVLTAEYINMLYASRKPRHGKLGQYQLIGEKANLSRLLRYSFSSSGLRRRQKGTSDKKQLASSLLGSSLRLLSFAYLIWTISTATHLFRPTIPTPILPIQSSNSTSSGPITPAAAIFSSSTTFLFRSMLFSFRSRHFLQTSRYGPSVYCGSLHPGRQVVMGLIFVWVQVSW